MLSHPLKLNVLTVAALLSLSGAAFGADAIQTLIDQGNAAANREDYATAIPLYEQVVAKLGDRPDAAILKKNLAVLYVNHGVALQEQHKFADSEKYLDKALAIIPDNANAKEAKAGGLYYQYQEMKNANSTDYAAMRGLLEKAMAINPAETAFKKSLGSSYLQEAYPLAVEEKYAEAAVLLEKGMAYDEQNRALRQSLANVYLGLAQKAPKGTEQDNWLDKAVAVDNSAHVQEAKAAILKGGDAPTGGTVSKGFGAGGDAQAEAPQDISKLSVNEMVATMEKQLSIEAPKGATLVERLEKLEDQIQGKPQKGPLALRAKECYTALMGSYGGQLNASNVNLVQAPVETSENSYLDEVFKVTEGKVIRWGKFPIRVYVQEPAKDSPAYTLYKPHYKDAALKGLAEWKVRTNGFTNYVVIKNPDAADVVISFENDYVDRFADPDKTPAFYKNYTPPKRTSLMRVMQVAAMLTPGYFGLAPQAINAGLQYQQAKKLEVVKEESKIKLGLKPAAALDQDRAAILIQNMAAKEFGHVLGLKASSPQQGDLLYPELKPDIVQSPSARDLETLKQLYGRPPNIILNVN